MELTVHDWVEIIGAAMAVGGFIAGLKSIKADVEGLKKGMEKLDAVVMNVALSNQRQDNFERATIERFSMINDRFNRLEETLRDFQHGRNLIRD